MKKRSEIKKSGKHSLKKHYLIFIAACLIASFLGSEFSGTLNISSSKDPVQAVQTQSSEAENSAADEASNTTANSAENSEADEASNTAANEAENADESEVNSQGSEKVHTKTYTLTWADVLAVIAENGTEAGREVAEQNKEEEIKSSQEGNPIFERSGGVLASVANQITSGSIIVTLVAAIASITGSENIGILVLIILGAVISFGFWFFVTNVFQVATRRVFLEGMEYERVTLQRFFFLIRVKKWFKASLTMLLKYVLYTLWCLTIVGIFVKRYSYFLVPYIVAENPDIKAREAITLSRKMMKGHKWECFKFDLSFLGWWFLGAITLGLLNAFFTNPYKVAAFTGYYAELRAEAIKNAIPGSELLNDKYLYEKAGRAAIESKYKEVIEFMESPEEKAEKLGGWRGFLADNLGVIIMRRKQDRIYEERQAEYIRIQELIDDVQGLAYPTRLFPVPEENRRMLVQSINYMRHYTIWSLIAIFIVMSFVGWMWEVSLHLIREGQFVNRGALHGPWLPIYGTGSVLMLTVLSRLRKKLLIEFTATVVLCGVLEYMTSYVMEMATGGIRWWDYSGYFINLNGRICAEGLLVFGVGGLAIVYLIAPVIDSLLRKISEKKVMIILSALALTFAADVVYSHFYPNMGDGITSVYSEAEDDSVLDDTDATHE